MQFLLVAGPLFPQNSLISGGILMSAPGKAIPEVLSLTPDELQQMQAAVLDRDGEAALRLLKKFVKRLEEQKNRGLKSHLG
jgi:hypothetical protein